MAFAGFQNNGVEITGGNCILSYDPMLSGSYNTSGLPGLNTLTLGVSINFNGTNQYLTYNPTYLSGTTTSVTFGISDYTWETSLFIPALPGSTQILFDARGSGGSGAGLWVGLNTDGTIQAGIGSSTSWISTSSVTVNAWNRIAVVRYNSITTFYINGVAAGTNSDANNYSYLPDLAYIGSVYGGGLYFKGQLTNYRITNGTAVYTANYTPSNQPLNPAGSSLCLLALTNAAFITDSSPQQYTMTNNGSVAFSTNTSFQTTPGSLYLDGTSYLYANSTNSNGKYDFGTDPFTVEYWLYTSANAMGTSVDQQAVGFQSSSTNTSYSDYIRSGSGGGKIGVQYGSGTIQGISNIGIQDNAWNHIAWGRTSGGNFNIWVNGVLANSSAAGGNNTSSTLTIGSQNPVTGAGSYLKGYISQLRISNTQVYTSNNFGAPAYLENTSNTVTLLNTYTSSTVKADSSVNNIQFSAVGNTIYGGVNYGPYANNISDLSGKDNTGLLAFATNTASPTWFANKNGYWTLTGGGTNQQAIYTSNPLTNAPGGTSLTGGTVGAWIQTSSGANGAPIAFFVDSKTGNSNGDWGPVLALNGGNGVSFGQYDGGAGGPKVVSGSGNVADGNWHYVVGTISAGGNISVYVDGNLASSASFTSGGSFGGQWRFGMSPQNAGAGWSPVAVGTYSGLNFGPIHAYNTTLNANQITQNYNLVKNRYSGGNVTGSVTYTPTGNVQTFQVPAGVSLVNATVVGAGGGAGGNGVGGSNNQTSFGGYAASITGQLQVMPGQVLYVVAGVGGTNKGGTQGATAPIGAGAGGAGGSVNNTANTYGGAGGGFSGIFTGTPSQLNALIIAGGGGGGCGENNGNRTTQEGQGGNAASTLTGSAQAGFNHNVPPSGLDWFGPYLANISGNGTVVTCRFSTVQGATAPSGNTQSGGTSFTEFFQGQPISVTGVQTTTAYNGLWNVLTANASGLTFFSTVTGTATNVNVSGNLSAAQVRNFYAQAGGPAQYGQPGYMGFNFDQNGTSFAAGNGGSLAGGWGGYNQANEWNGGGGGGGGYFGGAGGAQGGSASGGGGGGSNYAAPSVISASVVGLVAGSQSVTGSVGGKVILSW